MVLTEHAQSHTRREIQTSIFVAVGNCNIHIRVHVCDLYRFLCMLYMIDRRPVIISALYLSIHSVFVDVMFHIHSANHRCTSGLLHH